VLFSQSRVVAVIEEIQLRARLFAIEEINQLGEAVFCAKSRIVLSADQ
jgi:hypothetical protein